VKAEAYLVLRLDIELDFLAGEGSYSFVSSAMSPYTSSLLRARVLDLHLVRPATVCFRRLAEPCESSWTKLWQARS
jgi:hypothetical protein